ncbi:predicted protein [Sparassis crispa]|uniref:Uncharacterized protein n=1 Tax=Sparassis crispa TaxID=139825 RepID=A0A401GCA4_9APHY|nr:predicted protein [Sparassis crispa]GBE79753.1 predicted protein [Sparassis crispa]
MSSPARSRVSPTRTRNRNSGVPPGFLAPPKPRRIDQMTTRELHDLYNRNAKALAEPTASSSTYAQRMNAEQAAIEARLVELVGVQAIQDRLQRTKIEDDPEPMTIDASAQRPTPTYRPITAKQRALAGYLPQPNGAHSDFTLEEAIRLEQEGHALNLKRQQEHIERKRRQGLPIKGESETRAQMEARMWAFMNHKPTESDMEGDDSSSDDDDPSTWFEDNQDDGRKGQDIVYPDEEDYSKVIRVDESKIRCYSDW